MYNPYFSMKYTDKIYNEALFPRFGLVMQIYFSFLKDPWKTCYKNSLILTLVLRKIHKMGVPLFCF